MNCLFKILFIKKIMIIWRSSLQLPLIQQQDFGTCLLEKISGYIRGITKQPFVVHCMMEPNLVHLEPGCCPLPPNEITELFIMELYENIVVQDSSQNYHLTCVYSLENTLKHFIEVESKFILHPLIPVLNKWYQLVLCVGKL